jgi:tetratricopeptide (TPR) repeat protein
LRQEDFLFDVGPPEELYLAVRAARRALAADPDDANAHLSLGRAYFLLQESRVMTTREGALASAGQLAGVRRVQAAAALHRAVTLDPDVPLGHRLLAQLYGELDYKDLELAHFRKMVELTKRTTPVVATDTPEQAKARAEAVRKELEQNDKILDQMESDVKRFQDEYELRAAGRTALDRAQLALEKHLGQKALDVLLAAEQKELFDSQGRAVGVTEQLELLVQTGQVKEALERMKAIAADEESIKDKLNTLPGPGMGFYYWIMTQAAAADGDYAEAQRLLGDAQADWARARVGRPAEMSHGLALVGSEEKLSPDLDLSAVGALTVGRALLMEAPAATGMPWQLHWDIPDRDVLLVVAARAVAGDLGRTADLDVLRGWLALEAGDTGAAAEFFDRVLAVNPPPDPPLFASRELAVLAKEWLDAAK